MAQEFGYRFLSDAVEDYYRSWIKLGESPISQEVAIKIRKDVEDPIGFEEMYKIEEGTTERS